ncbi:hypothetical protein K435DRAFT_778913 [Dendrothele bispora CBS 962.96]|uniref:Uncharacterized protein n=1 Tax=Dendrothele bispora (strain CBS 962.96) TaxID=1314807 RepID=A0A4V4HFN7_DENBC|nr:hypothetical protein K435DRAFT_778913 [Dendrothele bispora CBS 962.96]
MSYAAAAASHLPPNQPQPDPALLNTEIPQASIVVDDTSKINVVHPDFKDHPTTVTSQSRPTPDTEKRKPRKYMREAEEEGLYLWQLTKRILLRPGVAGGLVGLVNIGLFAGASHAFYTQPHLRRDTKAIGSTAAATVALLSAEAFAVEQYRQTPQGREEERRAREEGTLIYRHAREVILRPSVLGGLLAWVNTAVIGAVGYYSYINWDKPTWDRRVVSAVSVGLLALFGGEGLIAERYRH